MGFGDFLQGVSNYISEEAPKKYAAMFANATDDKLMEWYNEHQFDPDVDSRIIEVAEKELRRRHLI